MPPTSCTTVPTSEPDCSPLELLEGSEPLEEPWLPGEELSAPLEPEPAPG